MSEIRGAGLAGSVRPAAAEYLVGPLTEAEIRALLLATEKLALRGGGGIFGLLRNRLQEKIEGIESGHLRPIRTPEVPS